MLWIDPEECTGCGNCISECRLSGIELDEDSIAVIEQRLCVECRWCEDICPFDAIHFDEYDVDAGVVRRIEAIIKTLAACDDVAAQQAYIDGQRDELAGQQQAERAMITRLRTLDPAAVTSREASGETGETREAFGNVTQILACFEKVETRQALLERIVRHFERHLAETRAVVKIVDAACEVPIEELRAAVARLRAS